LDYSSVSYFHRNLEKSEYFYNPVLGKTEMVTAAGAVTTVKFEVTASVRTQKKAN
jgi:Tfp pilus assembly protein PilN